MADASLDEEPLQMQALQMQALQRPKADASAGEVRSPVDPKDEGLTREDTCAVLAVSFDLEALSSDADTVVIRV